MKRTIHTVLLIIVSSVLVAGVAAVGVGAAAMGMGRVARAAPPNPECPPNPELGNGIIVTPDGYDAIGNGTEPVIWVYPTTPELTGDDPTGTNNRNARNIQWAAGYVFPEHPEIDPEYICPGVANNGTVVLKAGTFDFGDPHTPDWTSWPYSSGAGPGIVIHKGITFKGEGMNEDGTPKTKIINGGRLVACRALMDYPTWQIMYSEYGAENEDITIEEVWFEGAFGYCLGVNFAKDFTVKSCHITDMNYQPNFFPDGSGGTVWDQDLYPIIFFGSTMSGKATVRDCVIKPLGDNPVNMIGKNDCQGIEVLIANCSVEIVNNYIVCPDDAIEILLNNLGSPLQKECRIEGNTVIVKGSTDTTPGGAVWSVGSNYITTIRENDIQILADANGDIPKDDPAYAILVSDPPYIPYGVNTVLCEKNRITMERGRAAFAIGFGRIGMPGLPPYGASLFNGVIRNNQVFGTAEYGILMENLDVTNESSGNVFLGNNFSAFKAMSSQIYLDEGAHGNYFGPDEQGNPNSFGNIIGQAKAGLKCEGYCNIFDRNEWVVNYPSWQSDKGLWLFTSPSQNNVVIDPYVNGGVKPHKQLRDLGTGNLLCPDKDEYPPGLPLPECKEE